jgi:hypothetical protein
MTGEIYAQTTAGVYSEVMNQIYDSFDKRIREAISNAMDAQATKVRISVFTANEGKIIIHDNGEGMTAEDLVNNLVSMGGGGKYNNEDSIGRIGIGALSIFAIGEKIKIRTRRKGDEYITIAELDFHPLRNSSNYSAPLSQTPLGNIKEQKKATDVDEDNFTEITVSDLYKNVLDIFRDEKKIKILIDKLERILPVAYRNDYPTLKELDAEIRYRLSSEKCIEEVALHIPSLGEYIIRRKTIRSVENVSIVNYWPVFHHVLEEGADNGLAICGYLFISGGKALPKGWQGINARVKNVAIESNTYFDYEDDPASRVRIGGELVIANIDENRAITTNRSGFASENGDYLLISEYMKLQIKGAANIIRNHSNVETAVKKLVGSVDQLKKAFRKNATIQDERDDNALFRDLDDGTIQSVSETSFSLESALKIELRKIRINCEVIWSSVLESNYEIEPQEDHFYTIYVHEDLHDFSYNVAGNTVEYLMSYCGEDQPLLIKKPGQVYLNLDNKLVPDRDLTKVKVGFVETMLTLYLNYLRCDGDTEFLYNQTVKDLLKT